MKTLGCDAAWGGWGWCLATEDGPIAAGHLALAGRSWRWSSLAKVLAGGEPVHQGELVWPPARAGVRWPDLLAELGDGRVVVEHAPAVYSGRGRASRGNQAATGFGLGSLAGPILVSGARAGLGYPWEVAPAEWRRWWGIVGAGGRAAAKAAAVAAVHARWRGWLDQFPTGDDLGARGDVAESILIAVGAARHGDEAPAGPRRRS